LMVKRERVSRWLKLSEARSRRKGGWGGEEMDDEHGKGLKALQESSSFCVV
jgi:hypothetical protein